MDEVWKPVVGCETSYEVSDQGRVDRTAAQKILKRPDIMEFDDGLFPGNPQSWRLQH